MPARPADQAVTTCPTCKRRPSMRLGHYTEEHDGGSTEVETDECPDPIHDLADRLAAGAVTEDEYTHALRVLGLDPERIRQGEADVAAGRTVSWETLRAELLAQAPGAVETPLVDSLAFLQANLPWTIHYDRDFRASPMAHKDFGHALLHVTKACGKIAAAVNDAEHAGTDWDDPKLDDYVADLVLCALRMANTVPGRKIDLGPAVVRRIETKNDVKLSALKASALGAESKLALHLQYHYAPIADALNSALRQVGRDEIGTPDLAEIQYGILRLENAATMAKQAARLAASPSAERILTQATDARPVMPDVFAITREFMALPRGHQTAPNLEAILRKHFPARSCAAVVPGFDLRQFVSRREDAKASLLGGYVHDGEESKLEAFHHGMDTVFNMLESALNPAPSTASASESEEK